MSRLYATMRSDRTGSYKTVGGQREIITEVRYGSRENSILAVRMRVVWNLNDDKPTVYIYPIDTQNVKVCQNR